MWSDDTSLYETFLNVVLDTQMICGMQRIIQTDGQTYRKNSKLNTLVWGLLTLTQLKLIDTELLYLLEQFIILISRETDIFAC